MSDPAVKQFLENIEPIDSAPPLRTINGFGFRLCGSLSIPEIPGPYVSAYWFVAFFLPIIPLGLYVVSGGYPTYKFHGKIKFEVAQKAYQGRIWWLIASAWLEGAALFALLAIVVLVFIAIRSSMRH